MDLVVLERLCPYYKVVMFIRGVEMSKVPMIQVKLGLIVLSRDRVLIKEVLTNE